MNTVSRRWFEKDNNGNWIEIIKLDNGIILENKPTWVGAHLFYSFIERDTLQEYYSMTTESTKK